MRAVVLLARSKKTTGSLEMLNNRFDTNVTLKTFWKLVLNVEILITLLPVAGSFLGGPNLPFDLLAISLAPICGWLTWETFRCSRLRLLKWYAALCVASLIVTGAQFARTLPDFGTAGLESMAPTFHACILMFISGVFCTGFLLRLRILTKQEPRGFEVMLRSPRE